MRRRIFIAGTIAATVLVIILCVRGLICNSEWYINNQLSKLQVTDEILEKDIIYSFRQEFKKEKLKVYVSINNVDSRMVGMIKNFAADKNAIILEFIDKDDFKVTDISITYDNLICTDDGFCRGHKTIKLKKDMAKDIKRVNPLYNKGLTIKKENFKW